MKEETNSVYTICALLSGGRPRFITANVFMAVGSTIGIYGKKVKGEKGKHYTPTEAGIIYDEWRSRNLAKHQNAINSFHARRDRKKGIAK